MTLEEFRVLPKEGGWGGPELEQAALESLWRAERWWSSAGLWFSGAAAAACVFEHWGAALCLFVLCLLCQLVSWRAMRGAQRLEQKRIERLERVGQQIVERWKGEA